MSTFQHSFKLDCFIRGNLVFISVEYLLISCCIPGTSCPAAGENGRLVDCAGHNDCETTNKCFRGELPTEADSNKNIAQIASPVSNGRPDGADNGGKKKGGFTGVVGDAEHTLDDAVHTI